MKNRPVSQTIPQSGPRGGATLSEVLVSLLVMSIGIVFLISMFPASVLKTAKANQLTVATGLRYNAEALLHTFPTLLTNTNGDGFTDNFYGANAFLLDPLAYTVGQASTPAGLYSVVGIIPRYPGGLPLQASDTPVVGTPQRLLSQNAALTEAVAGLADTWENRFESNRVSNQSLYGIRLDDFTTSGVEDPSVSLLSWLATAQPLLGPAGAGVVNTNPPPPPMRVILFDANGTSSQTRRLTRINTATGDLTWTEDLNGNSMLDPAPTDADENLNWALDTHPLPAGFTVAKVRIESATRKFTWMMTVRPQSIGLNSDRQFDIDCVVFHGRTFDASEERIYGTGPPMVTISNLVAGTTLNIVQGQRDVFVSWGTGTRPNLLRGGFLFDAYNGYWYQITNYSDPAGGSSVVTISEAARANSTLGVFFRTVVDVFPLEPQSVTLE